MQVEQAQLNEAIKAAFSEAAELQVLRMKKRLTGAEVQRLYGISKSRLERMRLDGEGPKYSKPSTGNRDTNTSTVFYSHEAMEEWLERHEVHPI